MCLSSPTSPQPTRLFILPARCPCVWAIFLVLLPPASSPPFLPPSGLLKMRPFSPHSSLYPQSLHHHWMCCSVSLPSLPRASGAKLHLLVEHPSQLWLVPRKSSQRRFPQAPSAPAQPLPLLLLLMLLLLWDKTFQHWMDEWDHRDLCLHLIECLGTLCPSHSPLAWGAFPHVP